ncbi:MAG: recombinase family protein, partial [Oscillospiraceae bacterium]|nr:recombinase family protein [Oscillospiraceae bacterium]
MKTWRQRHSISFVLIDQLKAKGVKFISLKEQIDTTTPAGEFMMKVFASLADFERQQI